MIHIYNVEHDQIQIKLIVNEFIHPELLPLSYINFEHLFAIITDLLLLLNQSTLCSIPIPSTAISNCYQDECAMNYLQSLMPVIDRCLLLYAHELYRDTPKHE